MNTKLDHIVIAAGTLEQGAAWVQEQLGVIMPYGGEHPKMGTHNHLMQIGNGAYCEIIAVNPDAPAPKRPRWFSLDDPFIRRAIRREPLILTWVVNTPNITRLHQGAPFPLGTIEPMSRGNLRWLFTIPEDGQLPAAGFFPTVIEWQTTPHPAYQMADLGCQLIRFEIYHPRAEWLKGQLAAIEASHLVDVIAVEENALPYFALTFSTPNGQITLSSPH